MRTSNQNRPSRLSTFTSKPPLNLALHASSVVSPNTNINLPTYESIYHPSLHSHLLQSHSTPLIHTVFPLFTINLTYRQPLPTLLPLNQTYHGTFSHPVLHTQNIFSTPTSRPSHLPIFFSRACFINTFFTFNLTQLFCHSLFARRLSVMAFHVCAIAATIFAAVKLKVFRVKATVATTPSN